MPEKLLTVHETAVTLSLRESTIRAWIAKRKLAFIRLGRSIRIGENEVIRLLDRGRVPAREAR